MSAVSTDSGAHESFTFDNTFVRALAGLYEPWTAAASSRPELLVLNDELANELGIDPDVLRSPEGVAVLVGNVIPDGATPVAMAYAGHQFGGFSPRLGDGRALLIGEILDAREQRRDLHLKGSGRTPFARGGDGKAAVGPMLREYMISEAMHALGIPTTRSLAVIATGDDVIRETMLPGAVLARVASSHLRVGTFQYAAGHDDPTLLRRLADYAIARHYPHVADASSPYPAFFEAVLEAQVSLVVRWMQFGFIHGVMNTDNMTISGETIDYGPCAFMEAYDPATVFSSIDHGGRYAYGNQPQITQWNLARLAETLLPLFDADIDAAVEMATAMLRTFPDRYTARWGAAMLAKLGIEEHRDDGLIGDWLSLLQTQRVDFTSAFRALSSAVAGDAARSRAMFSEPKAFDAWFARWQTTLRSQDREPVAVADEMNAVNPIYIPRNHLVEEALAAGTDGDIGPFRELLAVVSRPFDERPGLERYALPAPEGSDGYQTFCGT